MKEKTQTELRDELEEAAVAHSLQKDADSLQRLIRSSLAFGDFVVETAEERAKSPLIPEAA